MKTINIAHLYYDLMNLYGENGNMRVFAKRLEEQKVKVKVSFLTIGDNIDFTKYDFFYIGCGSEMNQELVLNDIIHYQKEIIKAIENGKFFLVTGNAIELFGQHIEKLNKKIIPTLETFDFITKETDFRIVGEQVFATSLIKQQIVGFQNRSGAIFTKEKGLFKVIEGTGFKPQSDTEGINKNNFYGTYLIGPLLVRNPYFTEYLIKCLLTTKGVKYNSNTQGIEFKAYKEFVNNCIKTNV